MTFTTEDFFKSILGGTVRGCVVQMAIFPLEVVKIQQQSRDISQKNYKIALDLFRDKGISPFYKGLSPQLCKTTLKQMWCWPMIGVAPPYLGRYGFGPLSQQTVTGMAIAVIDAALLTPFEKAKILSAFSSKSIFSFSNLLEQGWKGSGAHFKKLVIAWPTFLTAQQYLRDRERKGNQEPLSFRQLVQVAIEVSSIVSLITAPFDMINTRTQISGSSFRFSFDQKLYRGWPLSFLSLVIQNIASVSLLELLRR